MAGGVWGGAGNRSTKRLTPVEEGPASVARSEVAPRGGDEDEVLLDSLFELKCQKRNDIQSLTVSSWPSIDRP